MEVHEDIKPEQVADYHDHLDHIENIGEAHTNHPYAPFDVDLAEALELHYCASGMWWDTDHPKSTTRRHLERALPVGHYELPIDNQDD